LRLYEMNTWSVMLCLPSVRGARGGCAGHDRSGAMRWSRSGEW
jgi:hypothetical protein